MSFFGINVIYILQVIFAIAFVASAQAGVLPYASYAVAPYATSYSAHTVNHAIAAPLLTHAAPLVAAPAPLVAAHAPIVAAHSPLIAASAHYAYPYSAYLG